MVVIVDYKAGNLTSVKRALDYLQVESEISNQRDRLLAADQVIFPGVGAAAEAMENLRASGLDNAIRDFIDRGKPFLGICIGYQLLFEKSEENDNAECLGILPGEVVRFPAGAKEEEGVKIPQMGWNDVKFRYSHPLWNDLPPGSEFYFVHAYYPCPADENIICARTEYGIEYTSGVAKDNVIAFQFHPEKSGEPGLKLLHNFCRWNP